MLCVSSCATDMGWRKLLRETAGPPLPQLPTVQLSKEADGHMVAKVTNRMDQPIYYYGQKATSPSTYVEEYKWGRWVDTSWDWCGTGKSKYAIPGHGSQQFNLDDFDRRIRIYALFSTANEKASSLILLNSP